MIIIHYDFTDGTEVSYNEGVNLVDNFITCCLDFFSFDEVADNVLVINNAGKVLNRNALLRPNTYTDKKIHLSHNIHKMLKANSFNWE